jgi:hypothetical protein
MVSATASPDDPVRAYYDSLGRLHARVRQHTPFVYLAYKSMIPAPEDDFVGLAYKISCYVAFKFLIHLGVHLASPLYGLIPLLPFFMDMAWVCWRGIRDRGVGQGQEPETSPLTTLFFLTVGLLATSYLDKLPGSTFSAL